LSWWPRELCVPLRATSAAIPVRSSTLSKRKRNKLGKLQDLFRKGPSALANTVVIISGTVCRLPIPCIYATYMLQRNNDATVNWMVASRKWVGKYNHDFVRTCWVHYISKNIAVMSVRNTVESHTWLRKKHLIRGATTCWKLLRSNRSLIAEGAHWLAAETARLYKVMVQCWLIWHDAVWAQPITNVCQTCLMLPLHKHPVLRHLILVM